MSLWMCQSCHSLQGYSKTMRCFACNGPLAFADMALAPGTTKISLGPAAIRRTCEGCDVLSASLSAALADIETLQESVGRRAKAYNELSEELDALKAELADSRTDYELLTDDYKQLVTDIAVLRERSK